MMESEISGIAFEELSWKTGTIFLVLFIQEGS